ncbi:hypothetical protein SANT12839_022490 [Streptomyces antimycoticus]|uniref:Uncharacterized protein n=1 Tax=Streptomyces antimycoticus TaxID=68175 RepID=A0A4D4K4W5_9ACTN|nr:hypothetical protein SANT12839_022490 [Streptomyces antimycoticus]
MSQDQYLHLRILGRRGSSHQEQPREGPCGGQVGESYQYKDCMLDTQWPGTLSQVRCGEAILERYEITETTVTIVVIHIGRTG